MSPVLFCTFTFANGQLACLQGETVQLTWQPSLGAWVGDDTVCSPHIHCELICQGTVFHLHLDNIDVGALSGVCGPLTDLTGSGSSGHNPPGLGSVAYTVLS